MDSKGTAHKNCCRSLQQMRISLMPRERSGIAKKLARTLKLYLFCTPKKNASYLIEKMIQDTKDAAVAVVLWKNAILASMERVWMHRMGIILVPEGEQWAIAWLQVTPVKPT